MATAKIIFQQNGDGYSTPASRDDLVLGLPVTMLNQNNTGAVSWAWVMIDKPTGSSATIVSPTASTTTFTPDIVGTYLIHLSVNAGAATDQKGAAVKTANLHYRIPAATETIEFDGYRGWATATNAALKVLDDGYTPPSALPTFQNVYGASNPSSFTINTTNGGLQIHDAFTPTGINLFEVDAYGAGTKFLTVAAVATSVSNNLLVTGSNFIGVNTPSPLYAVHATTATDNYSHVQTRGTVSGGLYARTAATQGFGLGSISNDPLLFFTNNTPASPGMILTTSGAVGIGVTSPTAQLHVVGTGRFTGGVSLDSGFTSGAASSMSNFKITSLATPTVGTDAANKAYVDSAVAGAASTTLQGAYNNSIPASIVLNATSNGIIIEDTSGHLGSGLNGGHTPLFKIDAYNSVSNYMTVYRAGQELNRETGLTVDQTTGAAVGVTYGAIWGSGPSDVYAGGFDASGSKQQLTHYNGSVWSVITTYPGAVGDTVNAIYGFAANNFYIGSRASLGGPGGIWHTTNSAVSWTQEYNTKGINTIWGSDSTHIYAGVQDNSGVVLFSAGGGSWSPVAGNVGTRFIHSIWGANSTEFWVATSDSIWHTTNSGATFSSQFDTNVNSTGFISIGFSVNWNSIWGTSSSNVYAVGTSSGKGYIAHYNGSFWSLQLQNYPDPLSIGFTGVYGTTANDIYIVGGQNLLYSNGNNAWIPQQVPASILAGGVSLNAVWAPVYNQWYVAPSNTNPVSMITLAPQGGNLSAPGIGTFGPIVATNITTPDLGTNVGNPLVFTTFIDSNNDADDVGFIFDTTNPIITTQTPNYLTIFRSGGNDVFKIKGDGYLYVPTTGGFKQFGGTDIFNWTSSQITTPEALRVNNTLLVTALGTFQNHINVDGYTIDISGGAITGQALVYNGTAFVPVASAIAEESDTFNFNLTTDATPTTVATHTPSTNGNFVCYMYYRVDGYSTDVAIDIDWTDGYGAQTLNILPTTTKPVGSYSVASVYVQEVAGGTINIIFTAGTGVGTNVATNIFVSATIIRV